MEWIAFSVFVMSLLLGGGLLWRWSLVTAAPDEWLLRIRGGKLIESGVGVSMLRRPGDVLALFSSTLQRVGFLVETMSADRVLIRVEGFILWSVDGEGEGPFRAFRSLGLANLLSPPADLKHPKHLLTGPQHRAFQQIVIAAAQRVAGHKALNAMMGDRDGFAEDFKARLIEVLRPMGVSLAQTEVLNLRPASDALLADLSAETSETIREEASVLRREMAEREAQRTREQATREKKLEAEARRDRESYEAQTQLELEQQRALLIERQRAVKLEQLENEAVLKEREKAKAHEQALRDEARALEILEARLTREGRDASFKRELSKLAAEFERDAGLARLEVEQSKSAEVRSYELTKHAAEKVAASLKITDGRWVQVGSESPISGVGALITGLRAMLEEGKAEKG